MPADRSEAAASITVMFFSPFKQDVGAPSFRICWHGRQLRDLAAARGSCAIHDCMDADIGSNVNRRVALRINGSSDLTSGSKNAAPKVQVSLHAIAVSTLTRSLRQARTVDLTAWALDWRL